jgi:hypothetical protein
MRGDRFLRAGGFSQAGRFFRVAMLAWGAAITACGKPPPGNLDVLTPDDSRLAMAVSDRDPMTGAVRSWASAPWAGGEWIRYPGRIQLDVSHGLGRVPNVVLVYLSFAPDGRNPALAAGDLARIVEADETHVVVWNDTNGSYFARIVVF